MTLNGSFCTVANGSFRKLLKIYWSNIINKSDHLSTSQGSKTSSERLMYLQFTSCVYWVLGCTDVIKNLSLVCKKDIRHVTMLVLTNCIHPSRDINLASFSKKTGSCDFVGLLLGKCKVAVELYHNEETNCRNLHRKKMAKYDIGTYNLDLKISTVQLYIFQPPPPSP